jgi:steroid 5-alpha reductase family enzyme
MSFSDLSWGPVLFVGIAMLALWALSVAARDASIVDVFWGLGFVLIAAVSNSRSAYAPRRALVGLLVAIWGVRLATHLVLRNRGHAEDPRYGAMRKRWGRRFPIVSLVTVFVLQGVLMLVVSLPVQAAMRSPTPARITWLDVLGTVCWCIGFAFEAVGDLQLTRFRSVKRNARKVMDRGLWRYTRHPNYFGDCVQWWGLLLIALATGAWWSIVGPFVMTVLLLRVSGVSLLERRMRKTRPAYEDYKARTSAFLPRPPRELPSKAKEGAK